MKYRVIGVTGLPCAGKSLAAELLTLGAVPGVPKGVLLKADDLGHDILVRPEVVERLRARFGEGVIAPGSDPASVRRAIAARVFADPAELAWLERLVHPLVDAEVDTAVRQAGGTMPVIVEAALLFASGTDERCDVILVVEAGFDIRLRRASARGWDRNELERRQSRQAPLFEAAWRGPDRAKLVAVSNDADDGMLAGRIATALAEHGRMGDM